MEESKKIITSNMLKVIAMVTMVLDHIGYYFYNNLPANMYTALRIVGRCSMPIFTFLVMQGFVHTKNRLKYFFRLLILAIVTQTTFYILKALSIEYFENYYVSIYKQLNIVFSFALSVLMLQILSYKISNLSKVYRCLEIFIKILLVLNLFSIYIFINVDYSYFTALEIILMYYIYIICKKYNKQDLSYIICSLVLVVLNIIDQGKIGLFTIFMIPFISMYNGKLGKKSSLMKYSFYIIFPVHHFILCIAAMLFNR